MADKGKKKDMIDETLEEKKRSLENAYNELANKLRDEKGRLEQDMKHEYRNARRYVRANPEQGVGAAFAGGLLLGVILAKLMRH
ncbi:MAG: hypothetical protein WD035_06505 [Balneolaceae bacterium]